MMTDLTQKKKKKTKRPKGKQLWPIPLNIAYSIDYRDPQGVGEDTVLTFVFIGATLQVLIQCFDKLCHGSYIMFRYGLEMEHCCVMRNGKHFWRIAVTPKGYNPDFLSLEGLRTMIEWRIRDQGHDITFFPDYNKFLNL